MNYQWMSGHLTTDSKPYKTRYLPKPENLLSFQNLSYPYFLFKNHPKRIKETQAITCQIPLFFFFFLNFYLFIYLFMAVLGLRFCARAFSSCGKRGPLFIAVRGPLTIAASPVAEHRLQTRRDSEHHLNELQRRARAAAISADTRDRHEMLRLLLQPPRSLCASTGHSPHLPSWEPAQPATARVP